MKKIILIILCLLCSLRVNAQGTNEDILKSDYKKAYIEYNKNLNEEKTAQNYYNMCTVVFELNDYKNARKYCNEALNIIEKEKHPDKELSSDIYAMMGYINSDYYKNTDVTLDYYNLAKKLKENNKDTDEYELAKLYSAMGLLYKQTDNEEISKEYYEKALKLADKKGGKYNKLRAVIYKNIGEYEKAIMEIESAGEYKSYLLSGEIYKKYAQSLKDENKSKEYFIKSEKEYEKYPNEMQINSEMSSSDEEYPYDSMQNILKGSQCLKTDEKKAPEYFERAIIVNPNNAKIYTNIALAYAQAYSKGRIYYKSEAVKYIKKALETAPNSYEIKKDCSDTYKILNMKKEAEKLLSNKK